MGLTGEPRLVPLYDIIMSVANASIAGWYQLKTQANQYLVLNIMLNDAPVLRIDENPDLVLHGKLSDFLQASMKLSEGSNILLCHIRVHSIFV